MELKKYKAFLAAVDLGSFTKAAERLGYTPSGITHMMNAFEDELGFPLFTRGKKGVTLTESGERLVPVLRELMQVEESFSQAVAEINGMYVGTLNIGSYSSIAVQWLPNIIKEFQRDYPQIRINLWEGTSQEVVALLEDRQVDLGLMSRREDMKFDWIPLRDDPMVAVLPPNHPLALARAYPLERCEHEDFIMPVRGEDYDVTDLLRRENLSPPIRFQTYENYSAISMIECGLGMSVMNELITLVHNGNVVRLPLREPRHIVLGIAMNDKKKLSPAARKFISYMKKALCK